MPGKLITFEGTEGSGKSTQIQRLTARLESTGHAVVPLREPGGAPLCEEIRHLLKHSDANRSMCSETELLMMIASRAQLVREVIRPALSEDKIVLCDRFLDSTVVYQGHGRGLNLDWIDRLNRFAVDPTRPDLTVLLQIPLEMSEERRDSRNAVQGGAQDRFEQEQREFFERVESGYRTIAVAEPDRIRCVDATASVEHVASQIWNLVQPLLGC